MVFLLASLLSIAQNPGINKDGSPPHASAILDFQMDEEGVLFPRTDTAGIENPAHGLMIFDTLCHCFSYFITDQGGKLLDESQMFYMFADCDGDGYGDKYAAIYTSVPVTGYPANSLDCDDTNPLIFPSNSEICDSIDNDCDGLIDEGFDLEGDGITVCEGDCNGGDPDIFPGNTEVCDGKDNDCDSETNDGEDEIWFNQPCDGPDSDVCIEGIFICSLGMMTCTDDTGDQVEICGNQIDDDCDVEGDEGDCI